MYKKNPYNIFQKEILDNRKLLFWVVLVTVLSFGFPIANYSIGVDDPAKVYYFYSNNAGNMLQQGRLLHLLLNRLTQSIDFIPFFTDFVGAFLFALSALLFCTLFQYVTNSKLSTFALTAFACVYISHPIMTEKFIFELDVIPTMTSYCFCPLALLYAHQFCRQHQFRQFVPALLCLMISIASYESFIFLYVCGVFSLIILDIVVNQEQKTLVRIITEGLQYALILIVAVCVYYGLVYLLQTITGQAGLFIRKSVWNSSGTGFISTLSAITNEIIKQFSDALHFRYIAIVIFCASALAGIGLFGYLAIRKKNVWLFLCFLALLLSNFFIHYIVGYFVLRAAQTLCFFIGFVLLLFVETIGTQKLLRRLSIVGITLLVLIQSGEMNEWFYNDHVRYQKESFAVHTIATQLISDCDISKPVVITASEVEYPLTALYYGGQLNGISMLHWSAVAFSDKTQPFVSEIFDMYGYDFIESPTAEMYDQAQIEAASMPVWPRKGSIRECTDFIVVRWD